MNEKQKVRFKGKCIREQEQDNMGRKVAKAYTSVIAESQLKCETYVFDKNRILYSPNPRSYA